MMQKEKEELQDAERAKDLLKLARELAEEAQKSTDDQSKIRLEDRARKYLHEAKSLRSPARSKYRSKS
jgi:hypothetical protein